MTGVQTCALPISRRSFCWCGSGNPWDKGSGKGQLVWTKPANRAGWISRYQTIPALLNLYYVLSTNRDTIAESTISLTQRPSLLSFLYNTICSPQRSTLWAFTLVSFARSFNLNRIYKNLKDAAWPSDAKLTIYPVRYVYSPHLCVGLSGPLIVFFYYIYILYTFIYDYICTMYIYI